MALASMQALALEGMIGVHDPSTVAICEDAYYVFGTGRGISVLTSSNGFDWERGPRVFERIPESVKSYVPKNDGQLVWAPDIIQLNGEYYLYYSISAWGQFVSAVGLMTNPTLNTNAPNFRWTDRGMIVHSVEGENLNAIDPGVVSAPDGSLWICYGSYHGNIELVELNPKTGLRLATNSPVTIIASQSEAAVIIHRDDYFYLFVNHGSCCQGTNSTYHIRVGRSTKVTGPYLDRHGEDLARGAGTLFIASAGTQVGPGHFGLLRDDGVEKFSLHYEGDREQRGRSFLDLRPLLWTPDGWPLPGENLKAGTYQIRSVRLGSVLQAPANATNAPLVQTGRYLILDHQKWNIAPAGGGLYKIMCVASGKALQAEGDADVLATFTGADHQLWKIDQLTDGSCRVVTKVNKLALTAMNKLKPGNGIALKPYMGDDSQRWVITSP
ncbi:MAG: family 43 glycosylhydrolase [Akkermansiaceae bacterium]|nr:family 43 glycosylhydrolase [Verrucomicrobiales bacterium]